MRIGNCNLSAAIMVLLWPSLLAPAADSDAAQFARRVFEITKSGDFTAYRQLIDPRCHPGPAMAESFKLRSDLVNKLAGIQVEAMPLPAYQEMLKRKGAPPGLVKYKFEPAFIVIVHGILAGVSGGDRVELNPFVSSGDDWRILEGDCLSSGAVTREKSQQR